MISEVLDALSQKGAEEDALVEGAGARAGQGAGRAVPDLSGLTDVFCKAISSVHSRASGKSRGDLHWSFDHISLGPRFRGDERSGSL